MRDNTTEKVNDFNKQTDSYKGILNNLPPSDPDKRSDKFHTESINLAVINPGGLNGKTQSINNFINKFDIRICIISETHTAGKEKPLINKQMTTFFRNRSSKQNKGGIAIAIENSIAESCVLLAKGKTNLEWLAVKVNTFSPPLVIIATYGCQSSRTKTEDSYTKWKEVFDFANNYANNNHVLICGDMNAAIGNNLGIKNNDPSTNNNGRNIIKLIQNDPKWEFTNKTNRSNNRSHVNRSNNSTRCLDYIITNMITKHTRFYCDNEYQCTPYRVTNDNPNNLNQNRVYSDHKTIITSFRVKDIRDEKIKLPPLVIKNKEGWAKWYDLTHELAHEIIERVNKGQKGAKVMNFITRSLKNLEHKSFLKIKQNKVKRKLFSDNEMFMHLTSQLQKMEDEAVNMKDSNKIFRARKNKLLSERGEELFSIFGKDGKLLETKEEIIDELSNYNEDLLSRKEHGEKWKELFKLKKELTENLTETQIKVFNTLTPEDFMKAVDKIRKKNKALFKPFLNASPTFQAAFFFVIKAIYEEEEMPEDFNETELYPLFKKGDQRDPSNYRFLHMKNMEARLFEATVYVKIEQHLDSNTPEIQLGGMKEGDCLEHLITIASMTEEAERSKRNYAALFCDVKKMFDRVHLADTQSTLIRQGADLKAVKILQKLQNVNRLKVKGAEKSFTIIGGEGQGNSVSGKRISSSLAEVTTRHLRTAPEQFIYKHREISVQSTGFIDDAALYAGSAEAAKHNGEIYTDILDEMSLEAHPTKTVQVILGAKDTLESFKAECAQNPTIVQGNTVQIVDSERYLGQVIPTGGRRQYIDKNIADKLQKTTIVATQIRNILKIPIISRFGKTLAQKTMILSQLYPIITYGTQSWLFMTKAQQNQIEQVLKKAIETVLSLPPNTTYEILLHQLGLYHMTQVIHALKLKYFQNKLHIKKRGVLFRILRHEYTAEIRGGFSDEIRQLCQLYNLPDINEQYVQVEQITNACKEASMRRQWEVINGARHLPISVTNFTQVKTRNYFKFDTLKSRAVLCFFTGNIILRKTKNFMFREKHQGSKKCMFEPNCQQEETWNHFVKCPMYKTRYEDLGEDDLSLACFLVARNAERQALFGEDLFVTADHADSLHNDIFDGAFDKSNTEVVKEMLAKNLKNKEIIKSSHDFKFENVPTLKSLSIKLITNFPGGGELISDKISQDCNHKPSITAKRRRGEVVSYAAKSKNMEAVTFFSTCDPTLANAEIRLRTSKKHHIKFSSNLALRSILIVSNTADPHSRQVLKKEINLTMGIEEKVDTFEDNDEISVKFETTEMTNSGKTLVTKIVVTEKRSKKIEIIQTVSDGAGETTSDDGANVDDLADQTPEPKVDGGQADESSSDIGRGEPASDGKPDKKDE